MKFILLFCSACMLTVPALAEPYTYGPDNCEFQITFPEKPFVEKKCGASMSNCAEVATYTKAIASGASTSFRVSCNPLSPEDTEKFTPEIIKETLAQLLKGNNLSPVNIEAGERGIYKNASAISLNDKDGKPYIHNGQIWVGKKSMFTIEADMVGQDDKIDELFADIMRKSYPKDQAPAVVNETQSFNTKKAPDASR